MQNYSHHVIRKKVYVTRKIPGPGLQLLGTECDVTLNKKSLAPTKREMLKNIAGKDALLCMLSDKIDRQVMDAAGSNLKVISSYSTGFDHIDLAEAAARGIYVTFTAGILTEAAADLTLALLLACARNIVKGDALVRRKKWKVGWAPDLLLGQEVHGSTLGIIGLGRIGSAVARRAKCFGMKVLYHNRGDKSYLEELGASYAELDPLLARSDFVSLHVSLNRESRGLINMSKLRKMKRTAILINTSRGQVVNERDLAQALRMGIIAGAGLDVFEEEPLPKFSALLRMKNVILLPHLGSATVLTRSKMGEVAARNVLEILNGRMPDPAYVVNLNAINSKKLPP